MTEELKEFGSSKNNLWPGRDFTLRKTGLNPAPLRARQLAMLPICAALPPPLIQGVGSIGYVQLTTSRDHGRYWCTPFCKAIETVDLFG